MDTAGPSLPDTAVAEYSRLEDLDDWIDWIYAATESRWRRSALLL
jgi:hypothetical protein